MCNRLFQYETNIAPFRKLLTESFAGKEDCFVYRTIQDIPPNSEDNCPVVLRESNVGRRIPRIYTQEEVDRMSPEKQLRELGKFGLSVNDSPKAAIDSCLSTYQRLKDKGASPDDLETYKKNRGMLVGRFKFSSDCGVLTDFINNHANIFLFEGVSLEDIRDKDFSPLTIIYPSDDES